MKKIKHINKIIMAATLSATMVVTPVLATPSSSELKEEQAAVKSQAAALEKQLNTIVTEINRLRKEIKQTTADLEKAGIELEEAEVQEYEQYESMKLRIRYMYEESSSSAMLEKMLEAKSITDMLNQVEYVSDVHTYDRDMLAKYVEAKELVIEKHMAFEIKLLDLEEANVGVEKQQSELSKLLADKESEIAELDSEIAAAVKAEVEEAERRRAAEEAAEKAAEIARQEALANANNSSNNSSSDSNSSSNSGSSSGSSNSTVTAPSTSTGSVTGQQIVNYALQFVGNPYVYGGTSLTNGIDCSGFTQAIYRAFGYTLPRTSTSQRSAGTTVSYSAAQPGDIICYSGHVAIYMGSGMIVHASNSQPYPAGGIKTGSATYATILSVRRIL